MSKHTPGPWVLESPESGGRVLAQDERATIIHTPTGSPFNELVIADARLIAAAPDLLDALEELANGYKGNRWDVGLVPRIKKARAAIAKATGTPNA